MNKNKVAVLLSGHVRSYESLQQVVEGIEKNLIKINPEYDFKFFIYTWSKLDWLRDGTSVSSNTNTDRNKIYDIIKFEDILIGEFTNPILINGSDRIYGQYSSVYKCNELKKNFEEKNYKFDICIRTRLDLKICEPIDLSSLDYSCYNITKDAFGFADWFCISSS